MFGLREGTLVVLAAVISLTMGRGWAQGVTNSSGEYTAPEVGANCSSDQCSTKGEGCASCVSLIIHLPLGAWVTKTHCFTNANYPTDHPRHDLHEVPCGADISWSRFDTPIITATDADVIVRTTYHNRSSDRTRDVKLTVEWQPIDKASIATK
jgi:hypothetical protein